MFPNRETRVRGPDGRTQWIHPGTRCTTCRDWSSLMLFSYSRTNTQTALHSLHEQIHSGRCWT